jgi:hypothetical protein
MASRANPTDMDQLLELLNASEGPPGREALPARVSDPLESEFLRLVAAESESANLVEVPVETVDEAENRLAAHIVRGMSKSKSK